MDRNSVFPGLVSEWAPNLECRYLRDLERLARRRQESGEQKIASVFVEEIYEGGRRNNEIVVNSHYY